MIVFNSDKRTTEKPDWRLVWESENRFKDVVLHAPEKRLAKVKLEGECGGHPLDSVCIRCLDRMETSIAQARKAILDQVCPPPTAEGALLECPEELALVNPMNREAFLMRLQSTEKLVAQRAFPECHEPGERLVLFTRELLCPATRCYYLRNFKVTVTPELLKVLPDARLTFKVDGEILVDKTVAAAASRGLMDLPRQDHAGLFEALLIEGDEADLKKFAGYMLPSNTKILVDLEVPRDVVKEGGITVEVPLARYKTDRDRKRRPNTPYSGSPDSTHPGNQRVNREDILGVETALGYDDAYYQILTPPVNSHASVILPEPRPGVGFMIQNEGKATNLYIKAIDGTTLTILRPRETMTTQADAKGWILFCGVAPREN